jgi:hypothetical protein
VKALVLLAAVVLIGEFSAGPTQAASTKLSATDIDRAEASISTAITSADHYSNAWCPLQTTDNLKVACRAGYAWVRLMAQTEIAELEVLRAGIAIDEPTAKAKILSSLTPESFDAQLHLNSANMTLIDDFFRPTDGK